MNQGSGFLLVVVGLLLLYVVIAGKFAVLENTFYQLFNLTPPIDANAQASVKTGNQRTRVDINSPDIGAQISLPSIFIPNYKAP